MSVPNVSVVMSVYNGERYLRSAIDSILGQTFRDFEFLIVNDGSADGSREIIRSYSDPRIRLIDNDRNLGLTRSLNVGLRRARAPLVARQDADDVSHPTRLERQLQFLNGNAEVALLGAQAEMIGDRGAHLSYPELCKATEEESIRWQMTVDSAFVHTSVMFRRADILEQFGGYDETFTNGQDADLWSRVAGKYSVRNLAEILVDNRVHAESISSRKRFITAEAIRRGESIYLRNLRRVLSPEIVPDEWVSHYVGLYVGRTLSAAEAECLLRGLRSIARQFFSIPHEPLVATEFRRVLAAKFMLLAASFRSTHRLLAARAASSSFRYSRRVASAPMHRRILRLRSEALGRLGLVF